MSRIFQCSYCNNFYANRHNLSRHKKTCCGNLNQVPGKAMTCDHTAGRKRPIKFVKFSSDEFGGPGEFAGLAKPIKKPDQYAADGQSKKELTEVFKPVPKSSLQSKPVQQVNGGSFRNVLAENLKPIPKPSSHADKRPRSELSKLKLKKALKYNEDSEEDGDSEDSEYDSDDAGDGIHSDSDSSSVANYLEKQFDNYNPDVLDGLISASEPIDMDTVEGIKSILESNNIPLIWKSLKQLVAEHSIGTKKGEAPYLLINLLLAELEKLGILNDEECELARKYMCGKNIENARQDLVEGDGIWPAIDDRLQNLAFQGLLDARKEARNYMKNIPKVL